MQISAFPGVRLAACLAVAASLVACGSRESASERRRRGSVDRRATRSRTSIANDAATANQGDPRIVVLGDSLTAGLGLSPEDAYPAVLQRRLDAKGLKYQVINAGISGDTSAGGLSRLDWALEGDVRVLIVALGGERRVARPSGLTAQGQSGPDHRARAGAAASRWFSPGWRRRRTGATSTRRRFTTCIPRWRRNTTWRSCRFCWRAWPASTA